ncbi:hypothetical protein M8J76_015505 [Diaphorina citri]|nr:hypothetical protein M8J76_015505 [Diaphorina citri]
MLFKGNSTKLALLIERIHKKDSLDSELHPFRRGSYRYIGVFPFMGDKWKKKKRKKKKEEEEEEKKKEKKKEEKKKRKKKEEEEK